jgi:SAM-dependent methyltransferase
MAQVATARGWPQALPWLAAGAAGALLALLPRQASGWRRVFMAGGFPASAALSGAAAVPAWAWLLPMGLLLAAYPLRTWRDAPLFPTPADALHGLADLVPLRPGARVLDAGCGLGHGLAALRQAWPQASIEGIEWSGALRLAAALRCPWARVRRGDMWADDWQGCAVVYLFQRPESMARAWAKASAELRPGAWLVSLAFEVPGVPPTAALGPPGPRRVWIYRMAQDAGPATGGSTKPPGCR